LQRDRLRNRLQSETLEPADRHVVDAGFAPAHQAVIVKLPLLVAVCAKPIAEVVAPLVLEADCDAVVVECPKLFYQPVIELFGPLAPQKFDDRLSPGEELGPISPAAVFGVGKRDSLRFAGIPRIFGQPNFLAGRLERKRRQRRPGRHGLRNVTSCRGFPSRGRRMENIMFKWFVKNQLEKFGRKWGYDTGYVREIVDEAGVGALMPMQALKKLGSYRKVPLDAYYGAALTSGKAADCGPCLQLGVSMAESEGVKPQMIRAILEQDYANCSKEALLGAELALATIARDGTGDEARAEILKRWGRAGLVSLAYAILAAQAYPAFKYAIGHGHACVRLRVGGELLTIPHPQYA
jgi:hypothetical protein